MTSPQKIIPPYDYSLCRISRPPELDTPRTRSLCLNQRRLSERLRKYDPYTN
nr:MAG TPA: hypothetical protein [Caudoviricetes sp.]